MSITQKEKELIAVGASIAAGCLPCTDYHARAVRQAGATEDEARQAAAIGLAIKRESLAVMGSRAAEHFGLHEEWPTSSSTEGLSSLETLIAIASAIAAQCVPALERHVVAARQQGLDDADVKRAVGIGRAIRKQAARNVDEAANVVGKASLASPCCEEPAARKVDEAANVVGKASPASPCCEEPATTPQADPCGCQA
jgi:AhpD family alkylhydroperoxidase